MPSHVYRCGNPAEDCECEPYRPELGPDPDFGDDPTTYGYDGDGH